MTNISRRSVLLRGLHLPIGGALLLSGCGGGDKQAGAGPACANPETMSDAEAGTRQALGYTEKSPDPQQVCVGCSYFHAGAAGCGSCDMFTGGAVNPQGHCASWNKKAA